ncbi:hypothetical protein J2858_001730 [Neorhizobium galegae]|uniref:PAS domain-containing protein n=1 Tax=Neorhizobium galegae TaxID=399 RepID=UPI001AE2FF37|nr:PAS domain-containing protein [Neorhizobium galegae]MBP2548814.1 hypothetical protein [Neorhizobium galegae]
MLQFLENDTIKFGYESYGLCPKEILQLFMKFNRTGFWRLDVDTGLVFCCPEACRIFSMDPTDGPIDLVELTSRIHPEDLAAVMEGHEAAAATRVAIQKTYRVRNADDSYKPCCSIGFFREKAGTGGEIVGFTYEMPSHHCELRIIPPVGETAQDHDV